MPSSITSSVNDSTEVSLRKTVAILSGNTLTSQPNDSTEVSLRKIVKLLGEGNSLGGSSSTFILSQTTSGSGNVYLSGDKPTLLPGDTIIISGNIVARDTKTDKAKTWKVDGTISVTQSGNYQQISPVTFSPSGTGPMSVSFALPLEFYVNSSTSNKVEWKALFTYVIVRAIANTRIAGCIDAQCVNFNANAQEDNGSCQYNSGVASSTSQIVSISLPEEVFINYFIVQDSLHNTSEFGPSLAQSEIEDTRHFFVYDGTQNYKIGDTLNFKLLYATQDRPQGVSYNGELAGTAKIGQTLKVSFYAGPDDERVYYVNLLPRGVRPLFQFAGQNYEDGPLYLTASDMWNGNITNKGYYIIYNSRGVPVWYARTTKRPLSLHLGCSNNRLITNYYNPVEKNYAIDVKSTRLDKTELTTVPTSLGEPAPSWDHHEAYEISGPAFRRGNIVAVSYSFGFYIQEISPQGSLVWDWKATDYFNNSDTEVYHLNSVDVHPVTGKYLVSLRNVDAVICIDFDTKAVEWILSDNNQLRSLAKTDIPWMQPSMFNADCGFAKQHDARWLTFPHVENSGFLAISLYDNGPGNRNSRAIAFRFRPYSYNVENEEFDLESLAKIDVDVISPYTGSYRIWKKGDKYRHTIQATGSVTPFVEFQTTEDFFDFEFEGNPCLLLGDFIYIDPDNPNDQRNKEYYRFIPVPDGQLRLENLLATSGKVLDGYEDTTQGLLFRWSGASSTTGENGLVLLDESGNGADSSLPSYSLTNDFTIVPNAINGQPAIQLTGNAVLQAPSSYEITATSPLTMIGVIQVDSPAGPNNNARWFGTSSPQDAYIATFTSGSYGDLASSSAMFGVSYSCDINHESYPLPNGSAETRVLVYTQDQNSSKFYVNGSLISTISEKDVDGCVSSEALPAQGFVLGGMWGNVLTGFGLVGEVMAYSRVLTENERNSLVSDLKSKYGISTSNSPIPEIGLRLWLKGDDGITQVGTDVIGWEDTSNAGNHLNVGAYSPTFTLNGINNLPAVDFRNGGSLQGPSLGQTKSCFVVYKNLGEQVGGYNCIIEAPMGIYSSIEDGYWGTYLNGDVNFGGQVIEGTYVLGIVSADGSLCSGFINSPNPINREGSGFVARNSIRLGNDSTSSQPCQGLVSEVIVYSRPLGTNEIAQVINYLKTKYGVA